VKKKKQFVTPETLGPGDVTFGEQPLVISSESPAALTGDVSANADEGGVAASSVEPVHVSTYSGEAYNGDDIYQRDVPLPIVINLATARIAKNPQQMLKDHDPSKPIGHHVPVITASGMRIENGVFSVPNAHRDEVVAGASNGFPWQASVRGRYGRLTLLKAGATRTVNGRTVTGPRYIADDFLWRETTATGLGANESGPQISISASDSFSGDSDMKFDAFVKACGRDLASLNDAERGLLQAAYDAKFPDGAITASEGSGEGITGSGDVVASSVLKGIEQKASETISKFNNDLKAAADQFEARMNEMRQRELQAAEQRAAIVEVFGNGYPELQASAIKDGWSKETMVLHKKLADYEKAPPSFDIFSRSGGNAEGAPASHEVLACALAISGGVKTNEIEASGYDQKVINEAESARWRGIGYHGLIRMALQASGEPVPHHISPVEYGRIAGELQQKWEFLKASGQLQASGAFSVMNLASITDDAINRAVHARYNAFQSVIPRIAAQQSSRDFRPRNNYRVMGGGFLQKLSESGELAHLRISDAKFTTEIDTQGAMLAVSRKYMVNDDLSIIGQFGEILGFKGAQTLERDFHIMLLTMLFWRTTVGANKEPINYIEGVNSAFGYDALKVSYDLWANMQDREGNPLNVGPVVLLVQSGSMALNARDINKSEKVMTRSDNTTKDRTEANVFQGTLNNVVETQWLNHASMGPLKTNTGWFQFSSPDVQPMFAVSYLDNQRVPKVETAPGSFNTLGQQMRVIFDYGMGQIDDIGAVFNKGKA
jgi:hypothetical protein